MTTHHAEIVGVPRQASERPEPITLRRALIELLTLPLAFVALLAAIFLVAAVSMLDAADRVGQRDRAIAQSFLVQKLLLDREAGLRGSPAAVPHEGFEAYEAANGTIDVALSRLGELLSENPLQKRRFADLQALYARWRDHTASPNARQSRRDGNLGGLKAGAIDVEGADLMARMRDRLAVCSALEAVLRDHQWRSAQATAKAGLIGAGIAASVLGAVLVVATRKRMATVSSAYEAAIAMVHERSEALRMSESRFESFRNNTLALTFIRDEEGRYVCGDRAWTALLRRPLAHPFIGQDVPLQGLDRLPGVGRIGPDEAEDGADARECQWITLEFPLEDGSGRRLMGGLAVDVTELRKTERQLRASEERYALAVRGSSAGIWDWICPTGEVYFSPRFKELLGHDEAEFGNALETFVTRLHTDDKDMVMGAIRDHLSGRAPFDVECRLRARDGEYRWFHARGQAIWNEQGQATRMSGSITDIDARKRAEAEILALNTQLERRLQRLASLRRIDSAITTGLEQNATLGIVLEEVCSQLHVDAADLLLLDPQGQVLRHSASVGFQTDSLKKVRIPLSHHGSGRIFLERRPLHVADLEKVDGIFTRALAFAEEGFVAYNGVPLIAKGQVKGVLEVFHRKPPEIDQEWIDFLDTLAGQAAIAVENGALNEELRRANAELTLAYDATIEGWSRALDMRDKETEGHSQRVTEMTVRLARAMAVNPADIVQIRRGALLHDIGKMGIPDRILLKPGALTDEEWQVMRMHPDYAREMLSPIEFLRPAIDIPYCHHEQWDGSGYPQGLAGEEIPLAARIFTLADIWDALSNDRPYRKAWPQGRVLEYITSLAGTALDPAVVETFLRLYRAGLVNDLDRSAATPPAVSVAPSSDGTHGESPDDSPALELVRSPFATLHAPASTIAPRTVPAVSTPIPPTCLKILIAEGHWATARRLKDVLEEMGHEATIAVDGREALQAIRRNGPSVVIADCKLAILDGPELCRRVRCDAEQRPPFFILTCERDATHETELPPGVDDFLARPFDPREVKARLAVARRLLAAQEQLLERSLQAERMYVELRHQNERLAELVATDPLTGLSNRRHLLEVLESQAALTQRQDKPLSLAILDVDHFKQYNDDYGHRAGDEVLSLIADILRSNVRACDLVARYGGEEFVVVMPMTDPAGSLEAAERLRAAIAGFSWPLRPVTSSVGVATMEPELQVISRLIDAADQALYRSKQRGRNCTTHSIESCEESERHGLLTAM